MNKYVKNGACLLVGVVKVSFTKLFHPFNFHASVRSILSPFTEITLDRRAKLSIGMRFRMRDGAKIRVRSGATCRIGNNTSINSHNSIVCHESITIGDNVQFAPNVQIYDHDHDYKAIGGISAMKYKTSPITIGNDVWIGANTVILRGTEIGDNCVVGAGCVLKGKFKSGSVIVQKRETTIK